MTEQLLKTLAEHGVLGIMLVITLITIFFLYKEKDKSDKKHFEDMKLIWQEDMKQMGEFRNLFQRVWDFLMGQKEGK